MTPEQRTELGLDARQLAQAVFAAFDPGTDHPALALFDRGRLVTAERVRVPGKIAKLETGERCRRIVDLVVDHAILKLGAHGLAPPAALVYELPQFYGVGKSKGNPNKLALLALLCGGLANVMHVPVRSPTPHDWIGTIEKYTSGDPWISPRGKIIAQRLNLLGELAAVQATHDAIDAAGIGLWALGRLGRVFPGST
jgi:hypothetical protein